MANPMFSKKYLMGGILLIVVVIIGLLFATTFKKWNASKQSDQTPQPVRGQVVLQYVELDPRSTSTQPSLGSVDEYSTYTGDGFSFSYLTKNTIKTNNNMASVKGSRFFIYIIQGGGKYDENIQLDKAITIDGYTHDFVPFTDENIGGSIVYTGAEIDGKYLDCSYRSYLQYNCEKFEIQGRKAISVYSVTGNNLGGVLSRSTEKLVIIQDPKGKYSGLVFTVTLPSLSSEKPRTTEKYEETYSAETIKKLQKGELLEEEKEKLKNLDNIIKSLRFSK
jgi:uncharacterized protein involved in high-affinity Fe2+ transport